MSKVLVTGGAGFIGSHLIDRLMAEGHTVVCVDDLSLGKKANIEHLLGNPKFRFEQFTLLDAERLGNLFAAEKFDTVFHMAANSDIQKGAEQPQVDLEKTFLTTFRVLEAMRAAKVKHLVFASTSAIYGELKQPLHEDIGPLFPISNYGAAKLSAEVFISAFTENYGIQAWIFRFPNVIGHRSTHGAMFDFIQRLKKDPTELRILGDGTQSKPYLFVKDLVDGILFGWKNSSEKLNYFNLGVEDTLTVRRIAEIVVEEMGLKNVAFRFTGGDRGWVGDVPRFEYDLTKIKRLGWSSSKSSEESVRLAVRSELGKEPGLA